MCRPSCETLNKPLDPKTALRRHQQPSNQEVLTLEKERAGSLPRMSAGNGDDRQVTRIVRWSEQEELDYYQQNLRLTDEGGNNVDLTPPAGW